MVTYSPRVETYRAEFKGAVLRILDELSPRYTQRHMAGELVTSDSTISRELSLDSPFDLKAFCLGLLKPEFSLPVLSLLAKQHGAAITRRIPVVGHLNGSVVDELESMLSCLGKFADHAREGKYTPAQCRAILHRLVDEAMKAEAEIDNIEVHP